MLHDNRKRSQVGVFLFATDFGSDLRDYDLS